MLGGARLLTFAFRALVTLLLVSILWMSVAERYNEALVFLADPLLPDGASTRVLGIYIVFEILDDAGNGATSSVSIDGLTLHYGLILMTVLVLAAVGIGVVPRLAWLMTLGVVAFAMHVAGVSLLARGLVWASDAASPEDSGRLVFSLFAVFWGLLPAVIGGAWCFLYWIPRVSDKSRQHDDSSTPRQEVAEDQPQSKELNVWRK